MVVTYNSSRSDVWRAYWYSWRHSHRMKAIQLALFGFVFLSGRSWLSSTSIDSTTRSVGALVIACLATVFLPVYPLLRFKPEKRMLSISPAGISTTIGRLSGEIPWTQVARIASVAQCTYVVGKNGNSFSIPNGAFSSEQDRTTFLRQATQWWHEARAV